MFTTLPRLSQKHLLIALLSCFAAASLGSIFTVSAIPSWYATLVKPSFTPPNMVFGPVWTLLYVSMALAVAYVWSLPKNTVAKRFAVRVFFIQLVLNALWTVLFFGLHRPDLAFAEILILLAAITYTIRRFYLLLPLSGLLLIPYLLWVSFAAALNFSIVLLNR